SCNQKRREEEPRRMRRAQQKPQPSKCDDRCEEEQHIAVEAEVPIPVGHRGVEPIIDKAPQAQAQELSRMGADEVERLAFTHLEEWNLSHLLIEAQLDRILTGMDVAAPNAYCIVGIAQS